MAYEYEHDVISELEQMGVDYQSNGYFNMSIEVEEAYRKAKAWDNYLLSVEEDVKNEFGDNESLIKHAVELNKKIFMEDE